MKTFKDLMESVKILNNEIKETNEVDTNIINKLVKFAQQISGAFQPDMVVLINKIETELNKFGLTLGDVDVDTPFEDEGTDDYIVHFFNNKEAVKNIFLTLSWRKITGQQFDYTQDGAKLVNDVHLIVNLVDPDDMNDILDDEGDNDEMEFVHLDEETEELDEAVYSVKPHGVKKWDDESTKTVMSQYKHITPTANQDMSSKELDDWEDQGKTLAASDDPEHKELGKIILDKNKKDRKTFRHFRRHQLGLKLAEESLEEARGKYEQDWDKSKSKILTPEQEDKKEDIVKGMKKKFKDFKARYGKDAESVIHATANKLALKEEQLDEISKPALKKYIGAASKDLAVTSQLQGSEINRRNSAENEYTYKQADKNASDYAKIRAKRQKGISKAVDKLTEASDETDVLKINVPAFIRCLEHAMEDVKEDAELHEFVENLIKISKTKDVLTTDDYEKAVEEHDNEEKDEMNESQ